MNNGALEPLRESDDILNQLQDAEKDWKENGGLDLKDIKKKYRL